MLALRHNFKTRTGYLFTARKEKVDRIIAVGNCRTKDRNPVENNGRISGVARNNLLGKFRSK